MKECSKCKSCYDDDVDVCPNDQNAPVFTISGSTTVSGRYLLESRLGQGGMGIVFRAKHKFLKSSHAVKVILPSLVEGDQNLLVRFNQEAVLAASIDHPNVIRVTDFGVENDIMPFLVMEFIDGIPLSSYLVEDKPLTLEQTLGLFIPVAEGVAEAHSKGIVHRDLKPQNVMVQKNLPPRKAVKVLDFGLAKIKSADSYPSLIQAKTMNIVGSPPYMSPEQWSGEGVDHRTDIYALSVILYQMLTGRLPFQADSMPAMMYQHLTVDPPKAEKFDIKLLPGLEAVFRKGLEKDPQNRHQSMELMLGELETAVGLPSRSTMTGAATEHMIPRASLEGVIPVTAETDAPLSESQRKRFSSFFDQSQRSASLPDPQLARDFLQAQDKIETAKTEAVNADMLVKELAEAQKEAEKAQDRALQAKQQIEADVRRQVEEEMKRLAGQDQEKREAEAERLAQEVEARRAAEERANYLAQAALEAQQLAEAERKKREEEAQQRELQQGVRAKAEQEAQALAAQVAEARKQYEEAREKAEQEARSRAELELKQKKIESEIEILTYNEAERRKMVEAQAQKQIEEQAARYASDAQAAKQRLDEAQKLIDLEAEKREKAEAARVQAEQQAERLTQEIIEVQRQMEEMRQHITSDTSRSQASLHGISQSSMSTTGSDLSPLTQRTGQSSSEIPSEFLNTGRIPNRKPLIAAIGVGVMSILLLAGGGVGLYLLFGRNVVTPPNVNGTTGNNTPPTNNVPPASKTAVIIPAGSFNMGRNMPDPTDPVSGRQHPSHLERVDSFTIDINETTNAQYAKFVEDTKHPAPKGWTGGKPPANEENFPVVNVSLIDARAYAVWFSSKEKKKCYIPTEIEWEYTARNGPLETNFPWEGEWKPDRAILSGKAVAVGTADDVTANGVRDMLGNVSEWTSSSFSLYKGHPGGLTLDSKRFVVRGFSFSTPPDFLKTPERLLTHRFDVPENATQPFLGFRLACDQ